MTPVGTFLDISPLKYDSPKPVYSDEAVYPELPEIRFTVKGYLVSASMQLLHRTARSTIDQLVVRLHCFELSLDNKIIIGDRETIERFFECSRKDDDSLQRLIISSLLVFRKEIIGDVFRCLQRPKYKSLASYSPQSSLKQVIWQSNVQRDIRSKYDMLRFHFFKADDTMGRLSVTCDLFYTFHSFDCYLYVEFASHAKPNVLLKLVLNLQDILYHVSKDLRDHLFDKGWLAHRLQAFLLHVGFKRSKIYSKACVEYRRPDLQLHKTYLNVFKCSSEKQRFLEKRTDHRTIVGQFVRRFEQKYAVVTVMRNQQFKQYDLEVYFPQTQKRFIFVIFDDELLRFDRSIVLKIFEVGASEILYIIEDESFNYQRVIESIKRVKVALSHQQTRIREKNLYSTTSAAYAMKEERVLGAETRKRKDESDMTPKERLKLQRANNYMLIYQWDHITQEMEIVFNPSFQPMIKIKSFHAVLKECLLQACNQSQSNEPYWFEIILSSHARTKDQFWSLLKKSGEKTLLAYEILFRLKFTKKHIFRNDKVTLRQLMAFYPEVIIKLKKERFEYSDLLKMSEDMYMRFRVNFSDPKLTLQCPDQHQISHFVQRGQLKMSQKPISQIRTTSRQYLSSDFPMLLCRQPFTSHPPTILCVMLNDKESLEFVVYSSDNNSMVSKKMSIAEVETAIPFVRTMIVQQGCREEIGRRLFLAYKNILLVDMYHARYSRREGRAQQRPPSSEHASADPPGRPLQVLNQRVVVREAKHKPSKATTMLG